MKAAWKTRNNAFLIGSTYVGADVLAENGKVYSGCNVEHKYRCHDVHAEVNAITNMVSDGEKYFKAILIVAERKRFTPCGSCMDWIIQHGSIDCKVAYQNEVNGKLNIHTAKELMPYYPED